MQPINGLNVVEQYEVALGPVERLEQRILKVLYMPDQRIEAHPLYFEFVSYFSDILHCFYRLKWHHFSSFLPGRQEYVTISIVRLKILPLLRRGFSPLEIKLVTVLPG